MQELPAFSTVQAKYDGRVEFLNISNLATDPNGPQYVKDKGFSWLFADSQEAMKAYGVSSIPTTLFIDASGNIKDKHVGGMEASDLEARIAKIL